MSENIRYMYYYKLNFTFLLTIEVALDSRGPQLLLLSLAEANAVEKKKCTRPFFFIDVSSLKSQNGLLWDHKHCENPNPKISRSFQSLLPVIKTTKKKKNLEIRSLLYTLI